MRVDFFYLVRTLKNRLKLVYKPPSYSGDLLQYQIGNLERLKVFTSHTPEFSPFSRWFHYIITGDSLRVGSTSSNFFADHALPTHYIILGGDTQGRMDGRVVYP